MQNANSAEDRNWLGSGKTLNLVEEKGTSTRQLFKGHGEP